MTYSIRMCAVAEYDLLVEFIKYSWNENHIFVRNKSLLDWQHLQDDCYNFVVAYHHESMSFHGVLGIISPNFFSKRKVSVGDDIWLALWKVEKSKAESNSIGIDLLNYVTEMYLPGSVSAIGINNQVAMVYKLMGFATGYLHQRFIVNPEKRFFTIGNIATVGERKILNEPSPLELFEIFLEDVDKYSGVISQNSLGKDCRYLIKRYIKHPSYSYRLIGIRDMDSVLAIFVVRKMVVDNSACLRIVDGFGLENIEFSVKSLFEKILVSENLEYVDFLCSDVTNERLDLFGFRCPAADSNVPHLFEPFVREPVRVHYAYKGKRQLAVFKGDSDLDRPNI